jgi:hypothetical protein
MGAIKRDEFLTLYQNQLNTIQEFKDKAWKATHYSVLGQAAVYGLKHVGQTQWPDWLLLVLSALVFIWAASLVNHLHGRVVGRRQALEYLRKLAGKGAFTDSFEDVWKEILKQKKPEGCCLNICRRWNDDWPIFWAYLTAMFVPWVVVSASIFLAK